MVGGSRRLPPSVVYSPILSNIVNEHRALSEHVEYFSIISEDTNGGGCVASDRCGEVVFSLSRVRTLPQLARARQK